MASTISTVLCSAAAAAPLPPPFPAETGVPGTHCKRSKLSTQSQPPTNKKKKSFLQSCLSGDPDPFIVRGGGKSERTIYLFSRGEVKCLPQLFKTTAKLRIATTWPLAPYLNLKPPKTKNRHVGSSIQRTGQVRGVVQGRWLLLPAPPRLKFSAFSFRRRRGRSF